ncbi:unnamed protein product [Protopolystoma xenopodis]|uniref:Uncharacterized protein n=1 Tax=Protopolystoma xenopodis TaxID=117903 RepID=A0A3S5BPZ8_9PLAT|nr:unnamed protein product [Protopolystoma xenopodis]
MLHSTDASTNQISLAVPSLLFETSNFDLSPQSEANTSTSSRTKLEEFVQLCCFVASWSPRLLLMRATITHHLLREAGIASGRLHLRLRRALLDLGVRMIALCQAKCSQERAVEATST